MKTINPKFPDQESITAAVEKLSPEDRKTYDALMHEYQEVIKGDTVDHEKIASLIAEAQKLLK